MEDSQFRKKGFADLQSYHSRNFDRDPAFFEKPDCRRFPRTSMSSYGKLTWEDEPSMKSDVVFDFLYVDATETRDVCETLVEKVALLRCENAAWLSEEMRLHINTPRM